MFKNNYKKYDIKTLIQMAQNGDEKALEEFIKKIQRSIFSIFMHLSANRSIISDLTQEALVKIAENINKLKDIKSYKVWMNRIALNVYYDEIRKHSLHEKYMDYDELEELNLQDNREKPMEKCMDNELGCIIKKCILSLPLNSRIAIVLREFEGMSYIQIANLTHTTIGTVKSRISRARLKLQEVLGNYI